MWKQLEVHVDDGSAGAGDDDGGVDSRHQRGNRYDGGRTRYDSNWKRDDNNRCSRRQPIGRVRRGSVKG